MAAGLGTAPQRDDTATAGQTAGHDVYTRLREDILSNTISPAHQLHEQDIAARLGTSRTPVREALIRLETEGLIEVMPRKGIRVVPVDAGDVREIYDILAALEALAAAKIAERSPADAALDGLRAAAAEMDRCFAANDLAGWAKGDDAFHQELVQLTGNARLRTITEALYAQAHRTQIVTLKMRTGIGSSNEEHGRIIGYLADGNREAARQALYDHRQRGGTEIYDILTDYGLPPL